MPLEDVVGMGRQLAEAIRLLHREARIGHFDIKPDNILLDEKLTCYLCDFSISLEFPEGQSKVSLPEDGYGSLNYMAPEQVRIGQGAH
jgi:eukaryotic-like serine/threonine-protein kinase